MIQLLNKCNAVLCNKSLHLPGCLKVPWCKSQLGAANGVLLVDTLIYYRFSTTKKAILYRVFKYHMAQGNTYLIHAAGSSSTIQYFQSEAEMLVR